MVKNQPTMQETRVRSLGWEVALEKGMAIYSSILALEIEAWGATVHGVSQSRILLSD